VRELERNQRGIASGALMLVAAASKAPVLVLMYPFSTAFCFLGGGGWELSDFERLYVCLRTTQSCSQNFSVRGVGSGWRRGGMTEDIYVFEDQG